jgi:magnesium-protoporphyrin IX monomethyl ester (oxidative) cyclase
MPFADVGRPSLGLGLLKAALSANAIPADVVYANVLFARHVGLQAAHLPQRFWPTSLIGEWVFAGAAFPGFAPDDGRYLDETIAPFARFHSAGDPGPISRSVCAELRRLRSAAPGFVDQLARTILARRPLVVGCSSMFAQQVPSLALLRRIRELDSNVLTILGGANVEGPMGAAVLENFPWVDAVCSGEADLTIVALCRAVRSGGRAAVDGPLPEGILTRRLVTDCANRGRPIPRATTPNFDDVPLPDHAGYFAAIASLDLKERAAIRPVLPIETSRGCWWNTAGACTFCGLNRGRRSYRVKKPSRALAEMEALSARHGLLDFAMVDNLMPGRFVSTLFARLERRGAPFRILYEVRPTLARSQVRQMAAAGVRDVQPGIESLDDRLLSLMNKGVSALQNIAVLKHAREFGVVVGWNLLTGFPGDSESWYSDTAELIPLLHHLQPPASLHGITLQRFSAYLQKPESYGLDPVPYNTYNFVYPLGPAAIRGIAYYFRDSRWPEFYPEMNRATDGTRRLVSAVDDWRTACAGKPPPQLMAMEIDSETLEFADTRSCACAPRLVLRGLAAHVYREAQDPVAASTLPGLLENKGLRHSQEEVHTAIAGIIERRLALALGGQFLSLATPERPAEDPHASLPAQATVDPFCSYLRDISRRHAEL